MASGNSNATLVKLVISDQNVQKLKLQNLSNIEELKTIIAEQVKLNCEFILQYLDPDFNDFFNLDNLENVTHMGTIKVLPIIVEGKSKETESNELSTVHSNPWPRVFPLPNFSESVFIKTHMERVEAEYANAGHVLVPEILKRKIVASMVEEIARYTYYPLGKDIDNMCRSLVEKYPFLKDQGPGGYSTWCTCVKFKVGNLRKSLKKSVPEIACNAGKRSKDNPLAPSPHSSIKNLRTGIVMIPRSCLKAADVDDGKRVLADELKKQRPDFKQVKELMGRTWPARWKFIEEGPPISEVFKEWPAYQHEQCVFVDFTRLTNVSLEESFLPVFDEVIPKILTLGAKKRELKEMCTLIPDSIEMQRDLAIQALRVLLGEKDRSPLITVFEDENTNSGDICDVKDCTVVKMGETYGLVIEKNFIATQISSLIKAICLMFAYIWVLNVQYPKENKYIWEFVEKVVLKIGPGNVCQNYTLSR